MVLHRSVRAHWTLRQETWQWRGRLVSLSPAVQYGYAAADASRLRAEAVQVPLHCVCQHSAFQGYLIWYLKKYLQLLCLLLL